MVKIFTTEELLDRVKSLKSFRKIPDNYWIVGVRSKDDIPNKFDDKFYLFNNERYIMRSTGTTNPGVSILKKFDNINSKGCAIVKSDEWYYDVWSPGYHKGRQKALVQMNSIKIYRDSNRDLKSDESGFVYTGLFGINFHFAGYDLTDGKLIENIDNWSAGCQVSNDSSAYKNFINRIGNQKSISYCLIKE